MRHPIPVFLLCFALLAVVGWWLWNGAKASPAIPSRTSAARLDGEADVREAASSARGPAQERSEVGQADATPALRPVTARVVDQRGAPLAATLQFARDGDGEPVTADSDPRSGDVHGAIPAAWTTGTVRAVSADGLRRAESGWSEVPEDPSAPLELGEILLILRPTIELLLTVTPPVLEAFRGSAEATVLVQAAPVQAAGTATLFDLAKAETIHEFTLGRAAEQTARVNLPASCIGEQELVRITWRFRATTDDDATPLRQDDLDVLQPDLSSTLPLGADNLLTGEVWSAGETVAAVALSALIKTDTMYFGRFATDDHGRFASIVSAGAQGLIWPDLLGQPAQVAWVAGRPARLEVDLEGFVRIRVVDGRGRGGGRPVTRCALAPAHAGPSHRNGPAPRDRYARAASGVYLFPRDTLLAEDRLFVGLPGEADRVHVVPAEHAATDGIYELDLATTRASRAGLRVTIEEEWVASYRPGVLNLDLRTSPLNERGQVIRHLLGVPAEGLDLEGLFPAYYHYHLRRGNEVLQHGGVALHNGEVAELALGN